MDEDTKVDLPLSPLEHSLMRAGDEHGFFQRLGEHHYGVLVEKDQSIFSDDRSVLIVTFSEMNENAKGLPDIAPLGAALSDRLGWSHLSIISRGRTWFRDKAVYGLFDRLIDDAFFEDFDRVIFVGSGAGGYGAAAFSVAAPGAVVFLMSPQATLNPSRAGWDKRFPDARRLDFTSRYGDASKMVDAAEQVHVFYDPLDQMDAMHAALFDGPFTQHYRCWGFDSWVERVLNESGTLEPYVEAAAMGTLTEAQVYQGVREKRDSITWMRIVRDNAVLKERPMLMGLAMRQLLTSGRGGGRIKALLHQAKVQLSEEGRSLPLTIDEKRALHQADAPQTPADADMADA